MDPKRRKTEFPEEIASDFGAVDSMELSVDSEDDASDLSDNSYAEDSDGDYRSVLLYKNLWYFLRNQTHIEHGCPLQNLTLTFMPWDTVGLNDL